MLVSLLTCYIWTRQVFSERLHIIWEVLYSITWIPWRFILVNFNFHVIQFSLMSVFLENGMKTYLLEICIFFLFAKKVPKNFLKLSKSHWVIFYRLVNFEIQYRDKLRPEELFDGSKWGNFIKHFIAFPRLYFSQLTFCYFAISNLD